MVYGVGVRGTVATQIPKVEKARINDPPPQKKNELTSAAIKDCCY